MNWADAVLAMVELLPSSRHARGGTSSMDLHRKFMPQLQVSGLMDHLMLVPPVNV